MLIYTIYRDLLNSTIILYNDSLCRISILRKPSRSYRLICWRCINRSSIDSNFTMCLTPSISNCISGTRCRNITAINLNSKCGRGFGCRTTAANSSSVSCGLCVNISTINNDFSYTLSTPQLLGVADLPQMRLYTNVFQKLGIGFAVVNNLDGYDEISLTDEFKVMTNHYETIYKPSELGFSLARQEELYGGNTPEEASKIFHNVLENKATKSQTDCVLINASFAIQAMEPAKPIEECVAIARESLESGKALNTLKKFVELNS